MSDLDYLMTLADAIGARITSGNLPRQDENGFYVMDDAVAEVVATVS